jgi:hypothetical protein
MMGHAATLVSGCAYVSRTELFGSVQVHRCRRRDDFHLIPSDTRLVSVVENLTGAPERRGGVVVLCQILDGEHQSWTRDVILAMAEAVPTITFELLSPEPIAVTSPRVRAHALATTMKIKPSRVSRRMAFLRRMREADAFARAAGASRLIFLDFEAVSANAFVAARFGGPPVYLFLHNHIQRARTLGIERRIWQLSLARAAKSGRAFVLPNTKTEQVELNRLFAITPAGAPIVPFGHRPIAAMDNLPVRSVLLLGPAREDKAPARLAQFLDQLCARDPGLLERMPLTVAGSGWSQYLSPEVAARVRVVDRWLTRTEYYQLLNDHRWGLVPYGPGHAFCGSGVLCDSLAAGRPVLVSELPVLGDIISRYADLEVGVSFDTADQFVARYSWLAGQTDTEWLQWARSSLEYTQRVQQDFGRSVSSLILSGP